MALEKLPFKRLQHLIGLHLSTIEDPGTQRVIHELAASKKRGYLTKPDLVKVCRWKSPRALRHIRRNRAATIERITQAAFATRSEQKRLALLMSLHGVSVPMASSILTLTNPARYGVIDIRVWQLLFEMRAVDSNRAGTGFDFKQWNRFLIVIRSFGKMYRVTPRDIERTLFNVHALYQKGTLYNN